MTATRLDKMQDWTGEAYRYRMEPPLEGHAYVIVSATVVMMSGPETYIFPAEEDGEPTSFGELDGSKRGTLSHVDVLSALGYEVVR
jgi:hypothetical protein